MRVLRYDVPVDGAIHTIECGPVLHVDCRVGDVVTVWALNERPDRRRFQVFATGEDIPDGGWVYVGTALTPGGPAHPRGGYAHAFGEYVWHLFEAVPF